MKKSKISLLALPLILCALSSCENSDGEKAIMPYNQEYDSSLSIKERLIDLEYGLLENFISNKKTFALLIQGDDDTCVCYSDFLSALDSYIKDNDARIYHIKREDLEENFNIKHQSNANTIAIFKEGKVSKQYVFKDSDSIIKDQETFNKKLESMVSWANKCYYVSESQLEALYSSSLAGFTILFGRESCSDCAYMDYSFFSDYCVNLKSKMYVFDADKVRKEDRYQSFKDEYGLSSLYNKDYGYGEGVFPTFQYVVPGGESKADMIKDMAVFLNDTLTDENGTYKISSTYWDGTRTHEFLDGSDIESNLLGKEIDSSEVYNGRWMNEKASAYHWPLIEEFIKFYVGLNE